MPIIAMSVVFLSGIAHAFDSITFKTPYDKFIVVQTGGKFSIGGKPVQNDLLKTLNPLLEGPLSESCPDIKGRPEIIASIATGTKVENREFFLAKGLVRSGNSCVYVTGDGLNFVPLHQSWLIGPFRETIALRSPLKFQGGGRILANLIKKNDEWTDTNPKTELDWDFFRKFEDSLTDYRVQYRVRPEAGKGKPSVSMISGNEHYVFFKLGPKLWAVQKPNEKWLAASGDWSFWYDLDAGVWTDRHTPIIKKIEAPGASLEEKQAGLKELERDWSRAIQQFYQRRLLDSAEDRGIRIASLQRLRGKPSWKNVATFIAVLGTNIDDEMLKDVTLALRIRNPKGSVFTPGTSKRSVIVKEWNDWWEQNKARKD